MLTPEMQEFIIKHQKDNIEQLILQKHRFSEIDIHFAVHQIIGRRKAKEKLPTWFENQKLVYPEKISLEQSSSEITANYKAQLLKGKKMADLTGGMGVDAYFFSKNFEKVYYLEKNAKLCQIVKYNFGQLQSSNIECIAEDSIEWLKNQDTNFDLIYLDPARRNASQGKVVKLEDCEPNILESKSLIFEHSRIILLKASPLLDLSLALEQLPEIKEIHVLSVENDCKELLFVLEKDKIHQNIYVHCINFQANNHIEKFVFEKEEEKKITCPLSKPLSYLYEPNVSILKAGAFRSVGVKFQLFKLHPHSHLYTSENIVENFNGRIFKIEEIIPFNKKNIKTALSNTKKANISVRNFPLTVEEIRKMTKINEGGDMYLFATTDCEGNKILIRCQKAK
ncbi:MAG: SAM-dependent methyltransferase [Flammeovirgaceae bacterium]